MNKEEVSKFENRPVYFGYDWQCHHYGWSSGFIHDSQCYSLSTSTEGIEISRIPYKYLTTLELPKLKISDLEAALILEISKKGLDNVTSFREIPVKIIPPYLPD